MNKTTNHRAWTFSNTDLHKRSEMKIDIIQDMYLRLLDFSDCRFSDGAVPSRFQWTRRVGGQAAEAGTVNVSTAENIRGI